MLGGGGSRSAGSSQRSRPQALPLRVEVGHALPAAHDTNLLPPGRRDTDLDTFHTWQPHAHRSGWGCIVAAAAPHNPPDTLLFPTLNHEKWGRTHTLASGASGVLKMLSRFTPVDTKPGTFFFDALVWNWAQVDFLASCAFSILSTASMCSANRTRGYAGERMCVGARRGT